MFFLLLLPHLFSMRKVELKIFEYVSKTEHTKNSLSVGIQLYLLYSRIFRNIRKCTESQKLENVLKNPQIYKH